MALRTVQSGPMRHRISIVRKPNDPPGPYSGTQNAYGEFTAPDVTLCEAWSRVNPIRGNERLEADRMNSTVTHRVFMRAQPGIEVRPNHRVLFGSRVLNIVSVIDHEERGQLLELMCEEVVGP